MAMPTTTAIRKLKVREEGREGAGEGCRNAQEATWAAEEGSKRRRDGQVADETVVEDVHELRERQQTSAEIDRGEECGG